MTDMDTIAHRYIDCWNETDATRRRVLIEQLYAPDARYTDPLVNVSGWDAIDSTIAGVQERFGGLTFSLGGRVDAHHDTARFTWHLGPAGAAEPPIIGFDVAVLENGLVRSIYGFLDKVPAHPDVRV